MKKDRKLIEQATKLMLLDIIQESDELKKKLTPAQLIDLGRFITRLPYNEAVRIILGKRKLTREQSSEYDSKTKKVAQYGLGAYAGRKVGKRLFGGKPIKVLGGTLVKGATKSNLSKLGVHRGGVRGVLLGVGAMYLYRRLSDPCERLFFNKRGKITCKMEATRKVIGELKRQINNCSSAPNPAKCVAKLQKDIDTWNNRLRKLNNQLY